MLIQCLAVLGALHLIIFVVAAALVAIYLVSQYPTRQPGEPGPLLPPTIELHLQSFGADGCNPAEPLHLVLVISYTATSIFVLGVYSALLVIRRIVRYDRSDPVVEPVVTVTSYYGAC